MGRVWQILLFVGLLIWVTLLGRGLWPALKTSESRGLIAMVFLSALCIGGFYATSLTWGDHALSMIEYWRWWLVHLWVEGFFECSPAAVIALLFSRLGLIRAATRTAAIVLETIVFLFGGILGTLHHLYFTGTPTSVIAIGAMFSALEVVPLAMIGVEAYQLPALEGGRMVARPTAADPLLHRRRFLERRRRRPARLLDQYADRALLHAGHEHDPPTAMPRCSGVWHARHRTHAVLPARPVPRAAWSDRLLAWTFWSVNIGLAMMVFMSLVPAGIAPGLGQHHARRLVRPFAGVRAQRDDGRLRLGAGAGDIVFAFGVFFLACSPSGCSAGGRPLPSPVCASRRRENGSGRTGTGHPSLLLTLLALFAGTRFDPGAAVRESCCNPFIRI